MSNSYSIPDDEDLQRLIAATEIPALLMLAVHLTGDRSLLRPEYASPLSSYPEGDLDAETRQRVREECFRALAHKRDSGETLQVRPDPADFEAIIAWAAPASAGAEDISLLDSFLVMDDEDRKAPQWNVADYDVDASEFRSVVVGAGLAGLLTGYRLKQAGIPFVIYERDAELGGTWWQNQYPDCRVDIQSHLYVYSFAPYDWSSYYATQSDMMDYLRHFAEHYGLLPHIRYNTDVTAAVWQESSQAWQLEIEEGGTSRTEKARFVVSAVGQLNKPSMPDFEGRDEFSGPAFHSTNWDYSVNVDGKKIGVIGTGASGLQVVPALARVANQVTVFQRNPSWLRPTPKLRREIPGDERRTLRDLPSYRAWYRFVRFLPRLQGVLESVSVDLDFPPTEHAVSAANMRMRELLEANLRAQIVDRPELEPLIIPSYPPGAKRVVCDDGTWVQTLRRENVRVESERISRFDDTGIWTADGEHHDLDVIIYSTGFDVSSFISPLQITGQDDADLTATWGNDPATYHGITTPGFPNLFMMYGPNTGVSAHGNLVFYFECQVTHILEAIHQVLNHSAKTITVKQEPVVELMSQVREQNRLRAWGWSAVSSWYSNPDGSSPIMWPLSTYSYWDRTTRLVPTDYNFK